MVCGERLSPEGPANVMPLKSNQSCIRFKENVTNYIKEWQKFAEINAGCKNQSLLDTEFR